MDPASRNVPVNEIGGARRKTAFTAAGVAVVYYLLAEIGLFFLVQPDGFPAFWPAAGLLPAVLLILRKEDRVPTVAAVFAFISIANMRGGMSPLVGVAYAAVNCAESVAAAWALGRITGGKVAALRTGDFFRFLFSCVLAICGGSALFGASVSVFLGGNPSFPSAFFLWWAAAGTGMMLVTPLLLSMAPVVRSEETIPKERLAELVAIAAVLSASTAIVFTRSASEPFTPLSMFARPWALLAPMTWAALRLQPRCVSLFSLLLWSIAIFLTSRGYGPYRIPGIPVEASFATLFAFLTVAYITSYVTASLLRETAEGRKREKETEARFAGLFEKSAAVMLLIDPETGRIEAANRSAVGFYGYPEEKLVSMHIGEINTLPKEKLREEMERSERGSGILFHFKHRLADGSVRDVDCYSGPSTVGRKTRLFSIVHDVTEHRRADEDRRKLERELEISRKRESLGTMASGIAHQFNNLLMGVLGYIELAKESLPPASTASKQLGEAETSAQRAAELSRAMLTYVGQGVRRKEHRELGSLVAEQLPLVRPALPANVRLEVDAPPGGPAVFIDPADVRQVLSHLVTNAWEAMGGAEGVVRVSVSAVPDAADIPGSRFATAPFPAGPWACLKVTDTGAGMDSEALDRIFDPFFTTKFTGRGLGLPVVQGIVRHYGGAIHVHSRPGGGTTVSVLFPENRPESRERPESGR